MAKALFFGLPLHGHTNPSLPLVRELVERGDEVIYFSTDTFASRIEGAGARYRTYGNALVADLSGLPNRMEEMAWLLMRATAEILDAQIESCRAERPDYVIADSVAPWGQWIGQALDVPVVTSVTTFAINRKVLALAVAGGARPRSARLLMAKLRNIGKALMLGRRLRRKYDVTGTGILGLVFGRSDLNIVYTSRYFQPCAASFNEKFEFIGPSIAARSDSASLPDDLPADGDLVYVSLGTLFNAHSDFYRRCFEAFGDQDVRVLMSIGNGISAASLGRPPANVVVQPYVAQLDALGRAAVFVTHGGMNSVSESLHHRVPMVVVPQMSEQQLVGNRVAALGAGLCMSPGDATADRLREAVRQIRADGRFREQAARVRQSFDAAGGVRRGADAIIAFTRRA
jgi:MGT family glycosyltransferase